MKEFKVVLFGSGGVGKSALTMQFVHGKFVEYYHPTVEDVFRKDIEIDGRAALLEVLDTAGIEQFASMRDLYIRNGEGFLIVYSVTSRETFKDISQLRQQILALKKRKRVPIVLVANKCDLVDRGGSLAAGQAGGGAAPLRGAGDAEAQPGVIKREVTKEDGQKLALLWDCPYFEASAKTMQNVNESFSELVHEIVEMKARKKGCTIL